MDSYRKERFSGWSIGTGSHNLIMTGNQLRRRKATKRI